MRASMLQRKLRPIMFPLTLGLAGIVTGCGGDDNGRVVGDSDIVPTDSLANCKLAQSLELTMMSGGDFETPRANGFKFEVDTSAGADRDCPQDSSKPCSVEESDETQMVSTGGPSPYTGVYNAYGESNPPAPPSECVTGTRGLHARAVGLTVWGGKLVHDFNGGTPAYFDASQYAGVSFWARTSSDKMGRSLFVSFDDKYTRENAYTYTDANGVTKPYCFDSTVDAEKCDRFGVGIGLETSWRFYKIPFSATQQRGYGVKSDRLHNEELLSFGMGFDVGDWDFWVDQVAFYKEKTVDSTGTE